MRYTATVLVEDRTDGKKSKYRLTENYNNDKDALNLRMVDEGRNITKTCSSVSGGFGYVTRGGAKSYINISQKISNLDSVIAHCSKS